LHLPAVAVLDRALHLAVANCRRQHVVQCLTVVEDERIEIDERLDALGDAIGGTGNDAAALRLATTCGRASSTSCRATRRARERTSPLDPP
jgi:hypothetical protein